MRAEAKAEIGLLLLLRSAVAAAAAAAVAAARPSNVDDKGELCRLSRRWEADVPSRGLEEDA